ncbi:hypothetical protein QKE30_02975 [Corynebacterium sp. c24Ua_83]
MVDGVADAREETAGVVHACQQPQRPAPAAADLESCGQAVEDVTDGLTVAGGVT